MNEVCVQKGTLDTQIYYTFPSETAQGGLLQASYLTHLALTPASLQYLQPLAVFQVTVSSWPLTHSHAAIMILPQKLMWQCSFRHDGFRIKGKAPWLKGKKISLINPADTATKSIQSRGYAVPSPDLTEFPCKREIRLEKQASLPWGQRCST